MKTTALWQFVAGNGNYPVPYEAFLFVTRCTMVSVMMQLLGSLEGCVQTIPVERKRKRMPLLQRKHSSFWHILENVEVEHLDHQRVRVQTMLDEGCGGCFKEISNINLCFKISPFYRRFSRLCGAPDRQWLLELRRKQKGVKHGFRPLMASTVYSCVFYSADGRVLTL